MNDQTLYCLRGQHDFFWVTTSLVVCKQCGEEWNVYGFGLPDEE